MLAVRAFCRKVIFVFNPLSSIFKNIGGAVMDRPPSLMVKHHFSHFISPLDPIVPVLTFPALL